MTTLTNRSDRLKRQRLGVLLALAAAMLTPTAGRADDPPAAPPAAEPAVTEPAPSVPLTGLRLLAREAAALRPLAESDAVRAWLDAVEALPDIPMRELWASTSGTSGVAVTTAQLPTLPRGTRQLLSRRTFDAQYYYYTRYGSPLVYARALDAAAAHGFADFAGLRVLDFGYGGIGHLRLLAARGAHAHGVDVDPILPALYSFAGDQGVIAGHAGAPDGSLMVVSGRWPADDAARAAIDAARGDGFDLMLSKNTLKRGYIRPDRPADRKHLIELGVDPAEFLKSVHGALRPGGALLIYNISPALSPPDQPFVPHSDGRSPWSREEFEAAGFEVVAFEHDDTDKVLDYWAALGYDEGKSREAVRGNLNANYTLVRRLAQPPAAAEATSR